MLYGLDLSILSSFTENLCKTATLKKDQKLVFKTNYRLMQVKSIAECSKMLQGEHSAIVSTFIKLPYVIKIFVESIFEWPFNTGFTVVNSHACLIKAAMGLYFWV